MDLDAVKVHQLASDIGCGIMLAHDLLMLAGGDEQLVRKASKQGHSAESVKALIINGRIKRLEER